MLFLPVLAGFAAGGSLIVVIGAQNAFVLRIGLLRRHVLPVVAICALSDAVLIFAGVAGVGALVRAAPVALEIARWAGAAFLIGYALIAARRAFRPGALEAAMAPEMSLAAAALGCLALTWLNPHVYLDTVVLLGSLAATHGDGGRWLFGGGAAAASATWFSALGFGARFLAPLFARPVAWRVLDGAIAVLMVTLGVSLVVTP
ncbi:LysE/ArgO family amino acid transporter [Lacisediminihabitans profunda]|uniref:Amino acid transporter n=1 Tax=Lacisediminihabitans profunda TaxID=2594790 RepID=A0A5C8UKN0_9MICO|nr:LysE/ArgO family amino acid transporter [Lacisediminihabitans profunda]TXN28713.1 amino acid transporter [Lacisediminihabitans profunda]